MIPNYPSSLKQHMGTAVECTNCHVLPSVELNLTKANFIQGGALRTANVENSQFIENSHACPCPVMFVYIRRLDRSPFCFIRSILSKLEVFSKETLYGLHIPWMYVICSVRLVKISSPNECDKILKIPNE